MSSDAVGLEGRYEANRARSDRRDHRRDDYLGEEAVRLHGVAALGNQRRPDDAADQRVARARGQAERPGGEVPQDRAQQPGEEHLQRDQLLVDDVLTKFKAAERPTAARGGSARVAIDVAIALAVSWKPFVKSNASAVTNYSGVTGSSRPAAARLEVDHQRDALQAPALA
jgi:hypothetical protein